MNMEFLVTKHPMISSMECKSVNDYVSNYIKYSDAINIATGFISNQSLASIRRAVEIRKHQLNVNLFVGMHSIQGFTELQYKSLKNLNDFLKINSCGNVFLSPKALFHGKLYSFIKDEKCIAAIIGSSNLDSFISDAPKFIESDALFLGSDAEHLDSKINSLINLLGVYFQDVSQPQSFLKPDEEIFVDYTGVSKVSEKELRKAIDSVKGTPIRIPLKTTPKSNLNTFFGAGKVKHRFSRRDWYEVEIILSKKNRSFDAIPYNPDRELNKNCHIQVITEDGYQFEMFRQGDFGKNFRSAKDLRILGRWIKRKMEIQGSLLVGQPVTKEILDNFGKHFLVIQKTFDNYWFLKLE